MWRGILGVGLGMALGRPRGGVRLGLGRGRGHGGESGRRGAWPKDSENDVLHGG